MAEGRIHPATTRSRIVGLLKVGFPLLAFGILAAVFLWRQEEDLGGGLTFSAADLEAMRTGLKLTEPQFSGASLSGDIYDFKASTVIPRDIELSMADIEALDGRVQYADGRVIDLVSETASINLETRVIVMETGIVITTSDGYRAVAERLDVDVNASVLTGTGPVSATGPVGNIQAGGLVISAAPGVNRPTGVDETLISFTNGVRLTYTPTARGD